MSSDETDNSADAIFTSQLFLYEAIGCISSTSATPVEKQALYARSVMDPLFSDLENHLAKAKADLEARKTVERAKGLLMKERGLDEDGAYRLLRKLAMDRGKSIGAVAADLLAFAGVLRGDGA